MKTFTDLTVVQIYLRISQLFSNVQLLGNVKFQHNISVTQRNVDMKP
jgi:hypothetical protein